MQKTKSRVRAWTILFCFLFPISFFAAGSALASPVFSEAGLTQSVMGALGAGFFSDPGADSSRVSTLTTLRYFGRNIEALRMNFDPAATPDEVASADFHAFGMRVLEESLFLEHEGVTRLRLGLAPMEIRVPLLLYPVGPLLLKVSAGVRFQGEAEGRITPTFTFPASLSTLEVDLKAKARASAFVDGNATLLVARAGLGGEVHLLEAQARAQTLFFFDGRRPAARLTAMAQFLRGRLYAFLDIFSVFRVGWSRVYTRELLTWDGKCHTTGSVSCTGF